MLKTLSKKNPLLLRSVSKKVLLHQPQGQGRYLLYDAKQLVPPCHTGLPHVRRVQVVYQLPDAGQGGRGKEDRPQKDSPLKRPVRFLEAGDGALPDY